MIVNRLPHLLESKGISIRKLSKLTGITYTTIRALYHSERRSVQLEVMDAICKTLKIQPGEIYIHVPDGSVYSEPETEKDLEDSQPGEQVERSNSISVDRDSESWKNW